MLVSGCAAASLSRALVLAAAARQPATLLARLDDAVLAALAACMKRVSLKKHTSQRERERVCAMFGRHPFSKAMRDCPWPLLDAFACNNCVAPPVGFRPAALLQKTRAAHAAFARGVVVGCICSRDQVHWKRLRSLRQLFSSDRCMNSFQCAGQTLFKDPLRWTSGELSCKPAATDALYEDFLCGGCPCFLLW